MGYLSGLCRALHLSVECDFPGIMGADKRSLRIDSALIPFEVVCLKGLILASSLFQCRSGFAALMTQVHVYCLPGNMSDGRWYGMVS